MDDKTHSPAGMLWTIDRVLYPATVGATLVILGMQVYEFWMGGASRPRYPYAQGYLSLLTAYAAQRELSKWKGLDEVSLRLRRGELFVGAWLAAWLVMTTLANLFPGYALPIELNAIVIGVLAVFTGTGISTVLRKSRANAAADEPVSENLALRKTQAAADRRVALLKFVGERGEVSAEEAGLALGLSTVAAWRALEALEKEGQVVQTLAVNRADRRYRLKD